MEEHDIADVIEYQEIYQLCKNDSRYIEFLEMLKKLVNKILNANRRSALPEMTIQIDVDLFKIFF